ncbi:MAG: hypothetical protein NXI04_08765 [Planctomycetaceae bacterium]|nr:hypothetical protein [Planctomycetaceae bacterium]
MPPLLLILLLPAMFLNRLTAACVADERQFEHVEIVVGDVLTSEGGGWSPESSPLKRPFGIDFTTEGRMFIVELEGGRIHRRDPTGDLLWVSGDGSRSWKGDDGPLGDATFNGMHNCAVTPNGDVYIADTWNHCIRRIDAATGNVNRFAGTGESGFSGDGGPALNAQFSDIMCVTLTPDADVLHVVDIGNRRIRAIDLATGLTTSIAGNGTRGVPEDGAIATAAPLVDPRAVAADTNGNLYILERGGHALRVVRPNRTIHTVAGNGEKGFVDGRGTQAQFDSPKHLCVAPDNRVYIADDRNAAIRRFDPDTQQVTTVLGRGIGEESLVLRNPHGVCWEGDHLYIVDTSHNRILRMAVPRQEVDRAKSDRP